MGLRAFLLPILILFLVTACQSRQVFDLPPTQNVFGQQVKYNNKVDMILIVDNSSSMLQHQTRLSSQMQIFAQAMRDLKMDLRVTFITSDMRTTGSGGMFVGEPKILSTADLNFVTELEKRVVQGESGSNLERGLDSLMRVLSSDYLATEGKGFWRDDSLLVILALSDEDDKSSVSSQQVADFLDQRKQVSLDGSKNWLFNFIGVTQLDGNCRTFNDYAEPGLKFLDLVQASAGKSESICEAHLATAVLNIQSKIIEIITDFRLERPPVLASISVLINGQPIEQDEENGWTYHEDLRVIRFHGKAVPPADARIEIDYKPREAK